MGVGIAIHSRKPVEKQNADVSTKMASLLEAVLEDTEEVDGVDTVVSDSPGSVTSDTSPSKRELSFAEACDALFTLCKGEHVAEAILAALQLDDDDSDTPQAVKLVNALLAAGAIPACKDEKVKRARVCCGVVRFDRCPRLCACRAGLRWFGQHSLDNMT